MTKDNWQLLSDVPVGEAGRPDTLHFSATAEVLASAAVFVDDLDRCLPDNAVELLEHIKLVLHQPGFAFVLGVNDELIQKLIEQKFAKEYKLEPKYCADYLDKIVQVRVPIPKRDSGEMADYIKALLDKGQVFAEDLYEEVIPLIADAGKLVPRAIVRLLNRIIVTSNIGSLEGKDYDPIALLLHEAIDEPRYEGLRNALEVKVTLDDDKKSVIVVGPYLAEKLEEFTGTHIEWIDNLKAVEILRLQSTFRGMIATLEENPHLFKLLKSEAGLNWLKDKDYRESIGQTTESAEPEKEPEPAPTSSFQRKLESTLRLDDVLHEIDRNMVQIPAGEFQMGGIEFDNEQPVHRVTLGAFKISAVPVTQAQYEAVMETNPSQFKGKDNPVDSVSWNNAQEFCKKLSEASGTTYKLPSEAQWEYACRAGSATRFCFGDDENELDKYAWYNKNSDSKTHPVGQKEPNAWGLYDMHGNVWEWCEDDWHDDYEETPDDGRAWIDEFRRESRVVRGGSWNYNPGGCRSADRGGSGPGNRYPDIGFRLVRVGG